jgi:cyclophilin family peptidyl-prolyl cis-trans isomerase
MKVLAAALAVLTVPASRQDGIPPPPEPCFSAAEDTLWDIDTSLGALSIRLFTDVAPRHAANIVHLAGRGYYDGLYFHRVIPGLVAQGGGTQPSGRGGAGPDYGLEPEREPRLLHDRAGLVSMVTWEGRSHASQFFLTLGPAPWLDGQYTVFGELASGWETLQAIESEGKPDGVPAAPIRIERSRTHTRPTASVLAEAAAAAALELDGLEPGTAGWRQRLAPPPEIELVPGKAYDWQIDTPQGSLRVRLAADLAPRHVQSLVYLDAIDYFAGLYFNRVIPGFIVQGGGTAPSGNGAAGAPWALASERSPRLRHDRPGRLSMVQGSAQASAPGQFFVTMAPTPWLDEQTTAVGQVIEGFETLVAIEALGSPTGEPAEPVPILGTGIVEATALRPEVDPALAFLRARLAQELAQGRIDKSQPGWAARLPLFPELPFSEQARYFWHLETSAGTLVLRFYPELAPRHVASFMYLTELGYFDGLGFHRVIPGFMAQGGRHPAGGPGYTLPTVSDARSRHDRVGVLSMANTGQPNTEGSEFFITFRATPHLDNKHTAFGLLVAGEDTLRVIEARGSATGAPTELVTIGRAWISVE